MRAILKAFAAGLFMIYFSGGSLGLGIWSLWLVGTNEVSGIVAILTSLLGTIAILVGIAITTLMGADFLDASEDS